MECVGVLPVISSAPVAGDDANGDPERRILPMSLGLLRNVVDAPFARYAETLRSAKVAIDIRGLTQETRVIGIVSALPNEGKTMVASNIAQLAAHSGQRAILIDADLRNPSLTAATAAGAREGLIEILSGKRREADVRWTDPVTGLHVIPAVMSGRISHTAELISSPAMGALLARLRNDYDYIFLDLPPIAPIVDVRAAARLIDGFLVVIEWGRTTKSVVSEAIGSDELIRTRAVGAVLNKANKSMLRRLESYKGRYYNNYYHDRGYPS